MAGDVDFIAADSQQFHLFYRHFVEGVSIRFVRGFVSVVPGVESDEQVGLALRCRPRI